ncbi:hypothetical protein L6452_26623 [Arctium lappa]|uniref:Uncharacterized protein n=1 Tax=Arctium lappa TaxID=4217 RepID=A0ACB8ZU12_ARCLA|nr:hypothetical protein L6452_26623 [Arctium lappa]
MSRVARMIMYGTFIMAHGQCYDEPTCYICILELPWCDDRWGSAKVSKRLTIVYQEVDDLWSGEIEECSPVMPSTG